MDQPRYEHDCENCVFLGTHEKNDLYFCSAAAPTVIARFGTHGDYISGLPLIKHYPVLALAAVHAVERDLLSVEQLRAAI